MKILIKALSKSIIAVLAIILLITSCIKDEFAEPEKEEIPVGEVITLTQLRSMFDSERIKFEGDTSIYAVVTMDERSGNIYRNAFIQDENAAITLRLMSPGGLYEGDSIRINIKNTVLGSYQGMLQLDSVNVDKNIEKLATRVNIEPKTLTIPQISSAYQAHLIKIENVQFREDELGKTFANADELLAENRFLETCNGDTILVRTSGYAGFAKDTVPEGNGSIIGVVSEYRGDFQLFIRRLGEVNMDGQRCNK